MDIILSLAEKLGYKWIILYNVRQDKNQDNEFVYLPRFFKCADDAEHFLRSRIGDRYTLVPEFRSPVRGSHYFVYDFNTTTVKARILHVQIIIDTIAFVDLNTLS